MRHLAQDMDEREVKPRDTRAALTCSHIFSKLHEENQSTISETMKRQAGLMRSKDKLPCSPPCFSTEASMRKTKPLAHNMHSGIEIREQGRQVLRDQFARRE